MKSFLILLSLSATAALGADNHARSPSQEEVIQPANKAAATCEDKAKSLADTMLHHARTRLQDIKQRLETGKNFDMCWSAGRASDSASDAWMLARDVLDYKKESDLHEWAGQIKGLSKLCDRDNLDQKAALAEVNKLLDQGLVFKF